MGVVRELDAEEGWGVIDSPELPGGCFVHYSQIQMSGYHVLRAGQHVRFTFETPGGDCDQDGCPHVAVVVHPMGQ